MYYKKLVEQAYQEALALNKNVNAELRAALRSHERMPLFLSNLAKNLEDLQASRRGLNRYIYPENQLRQIVYDFTEVFISGVVAEAESRYRSEVQKQMLAQQAQANKDLEATASGKVSGDFEEIFKEGGISVTDERSV